MERPTRNSESWTCMEWNLYNLTSEYIQCSQSIGQTWWIKINNIGIHTPLLHVVFLLYHFLMGESSLLYSENVYQPKLNHKKIQCHYQNTEATVLFGFPNIICWFVISQCSHVLNVLIRQWFPIFIQLFLLYKFLIFICLSSKVKNLKTSKIFILYFEFRIRLCLVVTKESHSHFSPK